MFEARSVIGRAGRYLLVVALVAPFLFPVVAMVRGSFKGLGWKNYEVVLSLGVLPTFFRNSAIVALCVIAIVYVCTMLAAFGFSKIGIRGKEIFFWMLLAGLTLPEVVLLAPVFATAASIGAYNTWLPVILPLAALQIPFAVLISRNFINGIPDELIDAARVDGASMWTVFVHIMLPLTRPIAAAIVVLTLIGTWNSYLLPVVFLQTPDLQTVTLVPQFFIGQYTNDQTKVLAAAVLTALPAIIAYLSLQRLFERGLSAGALK